MLDKRLIQTGLSFTSAKQAIYYGADLLFSYGYVKKEYADSVWEREKVYPTGIPTEPIAIAIPHTNCEFVNNSMVCMLVLDSPLKFRQMGNEETEVEAEIIIMLAINKSNNHIEFLSQIMTLFSDEELLHSIKNAKSNEGLYGVLEASQLNFN